MKKNKRNNTIKIVLFILTLIILGFGMTYAYFTATVRGNEEASLAEFSAGGIVIDFDTSAYINSENIELISDEDKETSSEQNKFTVSLKTSTSKSVTYLLSLNNITITDNLKSADFKWELLRNGSIINSGDFSEIGTATTMKLTSTAVTMTYNQQDSYIFRIWLSNTDQDQSNLYNGEFSAKISLVAATE